MMEGYAQDWWSEGVDDVTATDNEGWRQIGMLSRSSRCETEHQNTKKAQRITTFESVNRFATLGDFIQEKSEDAKKIAQGAWAQPRNGISYR